MLNPSLWGSPHNAQYKPSESLPMGTSRFVMGRNDKVGLWTTSSLNGHNKSSGSSNKISMMNLLSMSNNSNHHQNSNSNSNNHSLSHLNHMHHRDNHGGPPSTLYYLISLLDRLFGVLKLTQKMAEEAAAKEEEEKIKKRDLMGLDLNGNYILNLDEDDSTDLNAILGYDDEDSSPKSGQDNDNHSNGNTNNPKDSCKTSITNNKSPSDGLTTSNVTSLPPQNGVSYPQNFANLSDIAESYVNKVMRRQIKEMRRKSEQASAEAAARAVNCVDAGGEDTPATEGQCVSSTIPSTNCGPTSSTSKLHLPPLLERIIFTIPDSYPSSSSILKKGDKIQLSDMIGLLMSNKGNTILLEIFEDWVRKVIKGTIPLVIDDDIYNLGESYVEDKVLKLKPYSGGSHSLGFPYYQGFSGINLSNHVTSSTSSSSGRGKSPFVKASQNHSTAISDQQGEDGPGASEINSATDNLNPKSSYQNGPSSGLRRGSSNSRSSSDIHSGNKSTKNQAGTNMRHNLNNNNTNSIGLPPVCPNIVSKNQEQNGICNSSESDINSTVANGIVSSSIANSIHHNGGSTSTLMSQVSTVTSMSSSAKKLPILVPSHSSNSTRNSIAMSSQNGPNSKNNQNPSSPESRNQWASPRRNSQQKTGPSGSASGDRDRNNNNSNLKLNINNSNLNTQNDNQNNQNLSLAPLQSSDLDSQSDSQCGGPGSGKDDVLNGGASTNVILRSEGADYNGDIDQNSNNLDAGGPVSNTTVNSTVVGGSGTSTAGGSSSSTSVPGKTLNGKKVNGTNLNNVFSPKPHRYKVEVCLDFKRRTKSVSPLKSHMSNSTPRFEGQQSQFQDNNVDSSNMNSESEPGSARNQDGTTQVNEQIDPSVARLRVQKMNRSDVFVKLNGQFSLRVPEKAAQYGCDFGNNNSNANGLCRSDSTTNVSTGGTTANSSGGTANSGPQHFSHQMTLKQFLTVRPPQTYPGMCRLLLRLFQEYPDYCWSVMGYSDRRLGICRVYRPDGSSNTGTSTLSVPLSLLERSSSERTNSGKSDVTTSTTATGGSSGLTTATVSLAGNSDLEISNQQEQQNQIQPTQQVQQYQVREIVTKGPEIIRLCKDFCSANVKIDGCFIFREKDTIQLFLITEFYESCRELFISEGSDQRQLVQTLFRHLTSTYGSANNSGAPASGLKLSNHGSMSVVDDDGERGPSDSNAVNGNAATSAGQQTLQQLQNGVQNGTIAATSAGSDLNNNNAAAAGSSTNSTNTGTANDDTTNNNNTSDTSQGQNNSGIILHPTKDGFNENYNLNPGMINYYFLGRGNNSEMLEEILQLKGYQPLPPISHLGGICYSTYSANYNAISALESGTINSQSGMPSASADLRKFNPKGLPLSFQWAQDSSKLLSDHVNTLQKSSSGSHSISRFNNCSLNGNKYVCIINHCKTVRITDKVGMLSGLLLEFQQELPSWYPKTFVTNGIDISGSVEKCGNSRWVYKPRATNCGRGIQLFSSTQDLQVFLTQQRKSEGIIQEYLERPLLVQNRKFDIRIYLLLSRTVPFLSFYAPRGYCRLCVGDYKSDDFSDYSIHLTNQAQQKRLGNAYKSTKEDTTWTLQELESHLISTKRARPNWLKNKLLPRIKEICLVLSRILRKEVTKCMGSFELYGCDFILSEGGPGQGIGNMNTKSNSSSKNLTNNLNINSMNNNSDESDDTGVVTTGTSGSGLDDSSVYDNHTIHLLEINSNPAIVTDTEVLQKIIPPTVKAAVDIVEGAHRPSLQRPFGDTPLFEVLIDESRNFQCSFKASKEMA